MPTPLNRRSFLRQTTAAAAAGGYFVSHAAAQDSTSPNERLNIAAVGTTGRAGASIGGVRKADTLMPDSCSTCSRSSVKLRNVALKGLRHPRASRRGGSFQNTRTYSGSATSSSIMSAIRRRKHSPSTCTLFGTTCRPSPLN